MELARLNWRLHIFNRLCDRNLWRWRGDLSVGHQWRLRLHLDHRRLRVRVTLHLVLVRLCCGRGGTHSITSHKLAAKPVEEIVNVEEAGFHFLARLGPA